MADDQILGSLEILALLNGPSFKLRTQSTLASHIDENPPTPAPKSKADALEARTRLRAEYKHFMREVVKGGLGISNN